MRIAWRAVTGITLAAALLAVPSARTLMAQECARVAGLWYCRVCHHYHPNSMVICPYNPSESLQPQKQHFRELLQPSFTANRVNAIAGDPVELRWYTHCANKVRIEPDIGEVGASGMVRVRPRQSVQYRLVVDSSWSDWLEQNREVKISIHPASPQAHLSAAVLRVFQGDSVNLHWQTQSAQRIRIEPQIGDVDANGDRSTGALMQTTTFRLIGEVDGAQPATSEVTIVVQPLPKAPEAEAAPDMSALFRAAAPIIQFANKLPNPPATYSGQIYYTMPPSEQTKIDSFVHFLQVYPTVHVKVVGKVTEYRGQQSRAIVLANTRRDIAYDSLLNAGIGKERLTLGDPVVVADSRQADARTAVYLFAGLTPEVDVKVYPARVVRGEPAMLIWDTAYADEVVLPDGGPAPPRGVKRIVPSATSTLSLTAFNSYGFEAKGVAILLVDPPPAPPALTLPVSGGKLVADNMTDIFFPRGDADLDDFSRHELATAAAWLLQPDSRKLHIAVKGYCEAGEATTISERRAAAVSHYLESLGVTADRVTIEAGRASDLTDADEWQTRPAQEAADRRVHFVYQENSPGNSRTRSRP